MSQNYIFEQLDSLCLTIGSIQHEFLHAIGMTHEHQRPDIREWMTENPNETHFKEYHELKRRKDEGEELDDEEYKKYNEYMINYYPYVGTA